MFWLLIVFLTFGVLALLHSDNGIEFNNQGISKICAMLKDAKKVQGSPWNRQREGSVEGANQDIKNMLHGLTIAIQINGQKLLHLLNLPRTPHTMKAYAKVLIKSY